MTFYTGIIVGVVFGALIGVMFVGLLVSADRADRRAKEMRDEDQ